MDRSKESDIPSFRSSAERLPASFEDSATEITWMDILRFLSRQSKVIGGISLASVLVGLTTGFMAAPLSVREVFLDLTLSPELVLDSDISESRTVVQNEVIAAGITTLNRVFSESTNDDLVTVEVTPSLPVEGGSSYLQLVLLSEDAAILEDAEQTAINTLQTVANEIAESYIDPEIAQLDLQMQRAREKIALLEDYFASLTPPEAVDTRGFLNDAQLHQQAILAEEFSALADYQLQHRNLSMLQAGDADLVVFEKLAATQSQKTSSILRRLVVFTILGITLGVLMALIFDQLPKLQAALRDLDEHGHS